MTDLKDYQKIILIANIRLDDIESNYKKATDELTNNGFIEITRISRTPGIGTRYKFTNKWYM